MHDTTPLDLSYWLRLSHTPGIGITRLKKMLSHFESPEMICRASRAALTTFGLSDVQINAIHHPNFSVIDNAITWSQIPNHFIVPFTDTRYPTLLSEITNGPLLLHVQGNLQLLHEPQIAMVGSRRASYTGLELASEFAQALTSAGLVITSGLALGIDTACHEGALAASGKTIAVLGSGLKRIYPKQNAALSERIVQNGCLLSEFGLDVAPNAQHFPQRNRIISGLSLGTLVIEAAIKSGSLITAHYALEQNRDVFAIPGSPRNSTAKGCLSLIQQGAKCVSCVDDILNELQFEIKNHSKQLKNTVHNQQNALLDSVEQQVLACIEDLTTIDQICARSKLSAQNVSAILLQLELKDAVKCCHGAYIKNSNYIN